MSTHEEVQQQVREMLEGSRLVMETHLDSGDVFVAVFMTLFSGGAVPDWEEANPQQGKKGTLGYWPPALCEYLVELVSTRLAGRGHRSCTWKWIEAKALNILNPAKAF